MAPTTDVEIVLAGCRLSREDFDLLRLRLRTLEDASPFLQTYPAWRGQRFALERWIESAQLVAETAHHAQRVEPSTWARLYTEVVGIRTFLSGLEDWIAKMAPVVGN